MTSKNLALLHGHVTKWWHGVCLFIGETSFAFPWTLYESECRQRWVLRGSDTSVHPRVWLGFTGALCQALEVRKNPVGRILKNTKRWNGATATTTLLPHVNSRFHLGTLSHLVPWNKPIHGLSLYKFATVSLVLPMSTNTNGNRHFESGTS